MTLYAPSLQKIQTLHFGEGDQEAILRPIDTPVTYYEAFGMEPRLLLDIDALRDAFLELSRKCHPDYHATANDEIRRESLKRTSLINNAYKTLRDPQRRAEYLIEKYGGGIESNKNAVPAELLEEMFEIQEAGEELREARLSGDGDRLATAEAQVKPLRDGVKESRERIQKELEAQFARFDEVVEKEGNPESEDARAVLKDIRLTLDQMNYLRTVLRNLK